LEAPVDQTTDYERYVTQLLEPGEAIQFRAPAEDAVLALTDRRVVVAAPTRVALAIPFDGLRRVQFDIERARPATLVLVPELANHEAQVLSVPPEHYRAIADALVELGHRIATPSPLAKRA
jgi:hypothetical protein